MKKRFFFLFCGAFVVGVGGGGVEGIAPSIYLLSLPVLLVLFVNQGAAVDFVIDFVVGFPWLCHIIGLLRVQPVLSMFVSSCGSFSIKTPQRSSS